MGSAKHARYGASAAERWVNCSGSVLLIEKAPPPTESIYAIEGTQAHACLEAFLKAGDAQAAAIQSLLRRSNPHEMVEHALASAQVIWKDAVGHMILAETKVALPFAKDIFGTLDAAILGNKRLTVYDFKYGAGIAVEVRENLQMIFYALALAHQCGYKPFKEVELVILQPRAEHADGPVRRWLITLEALKTYMPVFREARERCELQIPGREDLTPGKHCKFCSAKIICPAIGEESMRAAEAAFDVLPEGSAPAVLPVNLSPATALKDLGRALQAAERLEEWIDAVKSHAFDLMNRGEKVPGFKLVQKRAQRKWKSLPEAENEARDTFGEFAFETTLLSPAQFERQLKAKDFVARHVVTESSGLTIAAESDKRPGVEPLEQAFEVLPC